MDENQGILLFRALEGLPFQIAGALSRLGKRILTLPTSTPQQNSARRSLLPIQTLGENWPEESAKFAQIIWTAPRSLCDNSVLDPDERSELLELIAQIDVIRTKQGHSPQLTLLLPENAFDREIEESIAGLENFNVLLSPAAWGFGDEALLDRSLELWKSRPGVLLKEISGSSASRPRRWISFEELASQVVVCSSPQMAGKKNVIEMEGHEFSLVEWQSHFNEGFKNEVGFMEKLASRLSSETLLSNLPDSLLDSTINSSNMTSPNSEVSILKSHEAFPNPPISLGRSLSTVTRAYEKNPEMLQCFLPGKSV